MVGYNLADYQLDSISRMSNGCILCGDVGSGKSRTAIGYYFQECGGILRENDFDNMRYPRDIVIITTAKKRNDYEWEMELSNFLIGNDIKLYDHNVIVDSWNNIKKYKDIYGAFFIFDEQRLIGSGAWVKSFYNIARKNKWILLSATPGDTWSDYVPVFIANGFFKNKTEFNNRHAVYSRYTKYPKIDRYMDEQYLESLRDRILVDMEFNRNTIRNEYVVWTDYPKMMYKDVLRTRWNPYEDKPIESGAELIGVWRKIVNTDPSKIEAMMDIQSKCDRLIVFYNFNYELEILKNIQWSNGTVIAEWNGKKHQPVPKTKRWVYLVQYLAGSEGWNCIETNNMAFFSPNYSYRIMHQCKGRIDRMNTSYEEMNYYHLKSKAMIDLMIDRSVSSKKKFNEKRFLKRIRFS